MLAVLNVGLDRGEFVGNGTTWIMRFRKGRAAASARGLTRAYLRAAPHQERRRERGREWQKGRKRGQVSEKRESPTLSGMSALILTPALSFYAACVVQCLSDY